MRHAPFGRPRHPLGTFPCGKVPRPPAGGRNLPQETGFLWEARKRALLSFFCFSRDFASAEATKGLSDRPLETFGPFPVDENCTNLQQMRTMQICNRWKPCKFVADKHCKNRFLCKARAHHRKNYVSAPDTWCPGARFTRKILPIINTPPARVAHVSFSPRKRTPAIRVVRGNQIHKNRRSKR